MMVDAIRADLRYAIRALRRRPLLTLAAALSLALGIGVNTTVFSIFEQVILRRLPVPAAGELVLLASPGPRPGSTSTGDAGGREQVFSYPLFRDLERLQFSGASRIVGHREFAANLAHAGSTLRGNGLLVSGSYFDALRLSPALGRLLTPADDRTLGGHPVAVLAHAYWLSRFGGDPSVVGQPLLVNGQALTIVGVAPAGFVGTVTVDRPHVFVPLSMIEGLRAGATRRNDHAIYLFARVPPGPSRARIESSLNAAFQGLLKDVDFPALQADLGEQERAAFLARQLAFEDGARYRNDDREQTGVVLGLLLALTGLVLLIACVNVANLLLVRASERTDETSVRLSLGASTPRLVRSLLFESGLLGALGAAGAVLVATATSRLLLRTLPPDDAAVFALEVNQRVLLFTSGLGLGTAMIFGLVPAWQTVRTATFWPASGAAGRSSAGRGTARMRASLATAQIGFATVLIAVAGLFVLSLANLTRSELGLNRDGLLTFRLSPYLNGYSPERAAVLFETVAADLRGVPGVRGVTASNMAMLADNSQGQRITLDGFTPSMDDDSRVRFARVGTDYFRTLGIPVLAGREFTARDTADAPLVAVVNEAFARRFSMGASVLGRRLAFGNTPGRSLDIEIVGLVRDAKYSAVRELAAPPQLFVPYRQGTVGPLTFYVRHSGDAAQLRRLVPELVARHDAALPVEALRTMDEQIWDNLTVHRVLATLCALFAALATALAALGLFAMLAFVVAQRTNEIGIRMAFGARPRDVTRMLFTHVGRMTAIGAVPGLIAAAALGRAGEALLFGVEGTNPVVLAAAAASIVLVASGAAVLPARRAARIDPVRMLRAE